MEANDFFEPRQVELLEAIQRGEKAKARSLLEENLALNTRGNDGITPLFWLIMQKDHEAVELALELGADPNFPDDNGDTPVTMMAGGDDNRMLTLLLKHGGAPNSTNRNGKPALFGAISQERWDNLKTLLEYGADADVTDRTGKTSVQYAAVLNQFEVAHYLIEHGADYRKRDSTGGDVAWEIHDKLENNLLNPEADAYDWALKVKEQLQDRGVEFPPPSPREVRIREGRPNRWDKEAMQQEKRE